MISSRPLLAFAACLLTLIATLSPLVGCTVEVDREGPLERAGENMDRGIQDIGEGIEEAGEDIKDAAEDASR